MSPLNNPYYYHPQPACQQAADAVFHHIAQHPTWSRLFEQGKMLGVLIVDPCTREHYQCNIAQTGSANLLHRHDGIYYLTAYSGVINGLDREAACYFVPPIYDLQQPDDFYLQRDAEISQLNAQIAAVTSDKLATELKARRKALSLALQREIFAHFSFTDYSGRYRNIIDIFADAKRGLPPGGAGECAAPRLLQYAYQHGLTPVAMAECWYGCSPRHLQRIHGRFYPSCIEKCSPILSYMAPMPEKPKPLPVDTDKLDIVYQDETLLVVNKPAGMLSTLAKDTTQPCLEQLLHRQFPEVKGPMLAHRLDQSTSGLMLAAKDAHTHQCLQQQFEQKTISKRYIATLRGQLHSACGLIALPLTVNPDDRPRQIVDLQFGKAALTYYQVIARSDETTTLALYPLTGRTHQLRVHCASSFGLDHPIVGDALYDVYDEPLPAHRLMLHAQSITFTHPTTGQRLSLSSPIPFS